MRIARGARITRVLEGDAVMSSLPRKPGPVGDPFDALAAAVVACAPGARVLMLGFAAGGVVALMRAAGFEGRVDAVDLDTRGLALYEKSAASWAGPVSLVEADAARYLAGAPAGRWDVVLDDLAVPDGEGITKPPESLTTIPERAARVLARPGLAVFNLLPTRGWPWRRALARVAAPFEAALALEFPEWENRVVLAGDALPDARTVGRLIRDRLRRIGAAEDYGMRVRRLGEIPPR